MIAVDTNILIHAHRAESPFNQTAVRVVTSLAAGRDPWAIPWPCVHEFAAIATNPRLFPVPTPLPAALAQVGAWLESPSLQLLAEGPGYFSHFTRVAAAGHVAGGRTHDARIAAICLYHRVDELLTADRDFGRFPELRVRNPLVEA